MEHDREADHGIHIDSSNVRFSNSPARRTQIQQVQSPTKSIHPEQSATTGQMESIYGQDDFEHRTTNFFDDDDTFEHGLPRAITTDTFDSRSRSRSPAKRKQLPPSGQSFASKCEPKRVSMKALEPESEGYQRMDFNLDQQVPQSDAHDTESYVGSVEEFLPRKSQDDAQPSKPATRLSSTYRSRTSGLGWNTSAQPASHQSVYETARESSMYSDKIDQRLGVHQMAYEMLIQGMMNDGELMQNGRSPVRGARASVIPAALRTHDPRSPRDQLPANPSPERTASQSRKKAHFVPPPIDVGGTRHSLPVDLVRTPYPYLAQSIYRRDAHRSPPPVLDHPQVQQPTDSPLTLSIRRSNPNTRSRVTTLTVPASNDYSAIRTDEKGFTEQHTSPHKFDDEALFLQMHTAYKQLSGPYLRYCSARSLSHIAISGTATRAADAGYGWLLSPRSPRVLAYRGLTDTFSEEKILEMYRAPRQGRQRFAFVHWARRLANAPEYPATPGVAGSGAMGRRSEGDEPATPSPNSLVTRGEQPEGLEFVVTWSVRRIFWALSIVILLAITASLLWVFLGQQTALVPGLAGYRGAGDRVGTGVLIGVLVLLIGLTGFGGWLGVSWLVM